MGRHSNGFDPMISSDCSQTSIPAAGWLYVLTNPAMPGLVKIGYSQEADPKVRFRQLSAATGVPERFAAHGFEYSIDCIAAETAVHLKLDKLRPNPKREFFRMEPDDALEIIREVIRAQHDPNSLGAENLHSALVRAIGVRDETIALRLIQGGADVNTTFDDAHSCYDAALARGLTQVVRTMEEKGAAPTSFALLWALDHKDQEAIAYGLRPIVFEQIDLHFGQRLLSRLISLGANRITEIRSLLAHGVNVNFCDDDGITPLLRGLYNIETATALLEAGADPNMNSRFVPPLIQVLDHSYNHVRPEMVRLLLAAGANPNVFSLINKTPLMLACDLGDFDSAGLLLDAGADAALQDRDGMDALAYLVERLYRSLAYDDSHLHELIRRVSAKRRQAEMISAEAFALRIIDHGADVNRTTPKEPRSFLHWAAGLSKVDLMHACLDRGGNVLVQDAGGDTVLHLVVTNQNVEMVAAILNHPSVSASAKRTLLCTRNADGATPLHCVPAGAVKLASMLLDHATAPALLLTIPDGRGKLPAVSAAMANV